MDSTQAQVLIDKTMVQPPYYALQDLQKIGEKTYQASFEVECLHTLELAPIGIAEFGRHIAILGTIAISDNFAGEYYCLATKADIKNINPFLGREAQRLLAQTTFLRAEGKKGVVTGKVCYESGEVIFEGEVEYLLMPHKLFERLQAKNKRETASFDHSLNPYRKIRRLTEYAYSPTVGKAMYGKVQIAECLGHFENYPAMPVAVIGYLLTDIAYTHAEFLCQNEAGKHVFYSKEAVLNSHYLAFAGTTLVLKSAILETHPDHWVISCEAVSPDGNTRYADGITKLYKA